MFFKINSLRLTVAENFTNSVQVVAAGSSQPSERFSFSLVAIFRKLKITGKVLRQSPGLTHPETSTG